MTVKKIRGSLAKTVGQYSLQSISQGVQKLVKTNRIKKIPVPRGSKGLWAYEVLRERDSEGLD